MELVVSKQESCKAAEVKKVASFCESGLILSLFFDKMYQMSDDQMSGSRHDFIYNLLLVYALKKLDRS